jgi:hypothetical protein
MFDEFSMKTPKGVQLVAAVTVALLPGVSSLVFHSDGWSRTLVPIGTDNENFVTAQNLTGTVEDRAQELKQMATVDGVDSWTEWTKLFGQTTDVEGDDAVSEYKTRYLIGRKTFDWTSFCKHGHVAPSLLVLGVQKSGTTSLAYMLRHPQIKAPGVASKAVKELHFFDKAFSRNQMSWLGHYPKCPRETDLPIVTTDMTPNYFCGKDIPSRLSDTYGSDKWRVKLVILLRRPTHRLHSAFHHGGFPSYGAKQRKLQWGLTDAGYDTFNAYAKAIIDWKKNLTGKAKDMLDENKYGGCDTLRGSLYLEPLERYFEHFQAKQFVIIPAGYVVAPKAGDESIANYIHSLLGLPDLETKEKPIVPMLNAGQHRPIEKELDAKTLWQLNQIMDELSGASLIASSLAKHPGVNLMGYNGGGRDKFAIARWLEARW